MTKLIRARREGGNRVGSTASHWLMLMLPVVKEGEVRGERLEKYILHRISIEQTKSLRGDLKHGCILNLLSH